MNLDYEGASVCWTILILIGFLASILWVAREIRDFFRKKGGGYYTTRLTANPPSSRKAFREE